MATHLITRRHHAGPVCFDLAEMEANITVESIEERNALANQDRHDRVPNFVGEAEAKVFAGNRATSNKPDGEYSRAWKRDSAERQVGTVG